MKPFPDPIYVTRPFLPPLNEFCAGLQEIWSNRWLTNRGPIEIRFEKALSRYLNTANVCLFNNGTLALQIALQGLEISGEVITTPFSFVATTHALFWNKVRPVFCDIEPKYYNIDPERIEDLITPWTTAILAVHVFGHDNHGPDHCHEAVQGTYSYFGNRRCIETSPVRTSLVGHNRGGHIQSNNQPQEIG